MKFPLIPRLQCPFLMAESPVCSGFMMMEKIVCECVVCGLLGNCHYQFAPHPAWLSTICTVLALTNMQGNEKNLKVIAKSRLVPRDIWSNF